MDLDLRKLYPDQGARKKRKRVGRGHASGSGQQAGRGHKGQQARAGGGVPYQGHEGGQNPLYKRSPKLKRFNPANRIVPAVINVGRLASATPGGKLIDLKYLQELGLISRNKKYLKILGEGEVKTALTVKAYSCSKTAQAKIEKAGGKVEILKNA
jgi:large subunit ribosomal protein L15